MGRVREVRRSIIKHPADSRDHHKGVVFFTNLKLLGHIYAFKIKSTHNLKTSPHLIFLAQFALF